MAERSIAVAPKAPLTLATSRAGILQRKCACGQHTGGGACADCSKKKQDAAQSGDGTLQRRSAGIDTAAHVANTAPPIVHDVLRSPGQPLDTATRSFFEPRSSCDFSQVPVHSGRTDASIAALVSDTNSQRSRKEPRALLPSADSLLRLDGGGGGAPPDAGGGGGAPDAGAPVAAPDAGAPAAPAAGAPVAPAVPAVGAPAAPGLPTANFARFVTAGPVHCCRIAGDHGCPAHLGPSTATDARNQNGMNLVFKIVGHRPTVEYGFVQVMHRSSCSRDAAAAGGAWNVVQADPPGTDDSPDPDATCTRPNAADEITMTDAPGFATALGAAAALPGTDERSQRMNATDWVIARERPGKWQKISDLFVWHSINRNRRNAAGNWELFPGGNAIGQGATRIGGCPPP